MVSPTPYRDGAYLTNIEAMVASLVLLVLSSAGAAQFSEACPTEPHAVAQHLAPIMAPAVDIASELAKIEAPKLGLLARAARAPAGNGQLQTPAGAAA